MIRAAIFPGKYVQGRNAVQQIGELVEPLGKSALLLVDKNVRSFIEPSVAESLSIKGISPNVIEFGGECTWAEIERVIDESKSSASRIIIGAGGGKTLDTAKASATKAGLRVVVIPTTASTDAPTSALSVIYNDKGQFLEYYFLQRNPDLVLMDTQIAVNAPLRFFVAGMGDAIATWFEADATARSGATTMAGGQPTSAGLAIARLCYDTLIEYGPSAALAVENHAITPAVDKIIEANTLLSGLGFESGGLAAAHSIHNGLTTLESTHEYLHGEKVAFGTLTQLILENKSMDEIETVLAFMAMVGLPVCFHGIGLSNVSKDDLRKVAEAATTPGETIHNEPMKVTVDDVVDAMVTADALGRSFPGGCEHE